MEIVEFPKMVYRINGDAIQNRTVADAEEQAAAEGDGFTTDLASLADDNGQPLKPAAKKAKG